MPFLVEQAATGSAATSAPRQDYAFKVKPCVCVCVCVCVCTMMRTLCRGRGVRSGVRLSVCVFLAAAALIMFMQLCGIC